MRLQAFLVFALAFGLIAAPASAQEPTHLPEGSLVAGVPLGGLGPNAAKRELRRVVSEQYQQPVQVRGRGITMTFPATRAGLRVDYEGMIRRAFEAAGRGETVDEPLALSIHKKRLTRTVAAAAARMRKPGRNARVRWGIRRVARIPHRMGLGVKRRVLRRALRAELLEPHEHRLVRARFKRVAPPIRRRELRRIHRTYISVDRSSFTLRLFKRLRVVRRYRIAVGASGFDTPRGLRRILSKQVNPAWHVPNRPWAGSLAGQVIPPGDPRNPLKARFMALGGGYGIHGTAEEWSLGTRASHGCIRMRVSDVIRLYARTPVGTPVLIR